MICPVCNNEDCRAFRVLHDDRYGYPGKFHLLKCEACGHRFIQEKFTDMELGSLYSNYYPRSSFDISSHTIPGGGYRFFGWLNGVRSSVMYWVPPKVRILDVGCGFGESLGYHQSRGCDVTGIEADENIKRVAKAFGYKVHVGLFSALDFEKASFDFVTLNQVIEHVADPKKVMADINAVLKPGGFAIFSTPNADGWGAKIFGRYWINWHAPYHLQFFSENSMKMSADAAGLKLVDHRTITNSEWLKYQWGHIATYPSSSATPSVYWNVRMKRSLADRLVLGIIGIVHRLKINHALTRIFDALGVGDNSIYVFQKC